MYNLICYNNIRFYRFEYLVFIFLKDLFNIFIYMGCICIKNRYFIRLMIYREIVLFKVKGNNYN